MWKPAGRDGTAGIDRTAVSQPLSAGHAVRVTPVERLSVDALVCTEDQRVCCMIR